MLQDFERIRTPFIEARFKHVLSEHPDWGPGVYPQVAEGPLDGDYMFEIMRKREIVQFRYYIDRQANTVNVVAVRSTAFGWM